MNTTKDINLSILIQEKDKRIAEFEQELADAIDNAPTKQQVRDEFESAAIEAWKKANASLKEQLTEVKAHNALLLEDKNASPAIIAGYREYNTRLIEQVADLKLHLEDDAENQAIEFARAIEEPYYISDNGGEGGKFIRLSVYNDLIEQLKAIKETQSAEVHDLKEQVRIRGERMEYMRSWIAYHHSEDYPIGWDDWFNDTGKAL